MISENLSKFWTKEIKSILHHQDSERILENDFGIHGNRSKKN